MTERNIFAYTAPGSDFPDYISINRRDEQIVITVRSGHGGDLAEMILPEDQIDLLIYTLRGARIHPLLASGYLPRPATNATAFPVPTDSLEKARMSWPRKPPKAPPHD